MSEPHKQRLSVTPINYYMLIAHKTLSEHAHKTMTDPHKQRLSITPINDYMLTC